VTQLQLVTGTAQLAPLLASPVSRRQLAPLTCRVSLWRDHRPPSPLPMGGENGVQDLPTESRSGFPCRVLHAAGETAQWKLPIDEPAHRQALWSSQFPPRFGSPAPTGLAAASPHVQPVRASRAGAPRRTPRVAPPPLSLTTSLLGAASSTHWHSDGRSGRDPPSTRPAPRPRAGPGAGAGGSDPAPAERVRGAAGRGGEQACAHGKG
jgi:hypothetical protein